MSIDGGYRGEGEDLDMSPRLRQLLAAYADEALTPSPASVQRVRASVLTRARNRLAMTEGRPDEYERRGVSSHARSSIKRLLAPLRVRPGIALAAAALVLLVVAGGALAASAPGGPLYGAKVWLQEMTLPASGEARVNAEERLLQDRLDEAADAAAHGNGGAVQAALDAYRKTMAEMMAAAGGDLSKEERIQLVLGRHRAVLQALQAQFAGPGHPGKAAEAIQQTLDRTVTTIEQVAGKAGSHGQGNNGHTEQTTSPTHPASPPDGTGKPARTPAAVSTEKPQHTPPPHPTPSHGAPGASGENPNANPGDH